MTPKILRNDDHRVRIGIFSSCQSPRAPKRFGENGSDVVCFPSDDGSAETNNFRLDASDLKRPAEPSGKLRGIYGVQKAGPSTGCLFKSQSQ